MFALVNSTNASGSSLTTKSITIPATTLNNLLVVTLQFTSATPSDVTVTDNAGNTYSLAKTGGSIAGLGAAVLYQFYAVQAIAGSTSITATWTTAASIFMAAQEFSGNIIDQATVLDTSASVSSSYNSNYAITVSPSAAGNLVVAHFRLSTGGPGTVTMKTGCSMDYNYGVYRLNSTASSEADGFNGTVGQQHVVIAAVYKAAAALPPTTNNSGFLQFM